MNIELLHEALPDKMVAETSDQIQFFLRTYADQQMRFVIYFRKHIDFEILKRAMRLTILKEPVFSYYYNEGMKTAWWQKEKDIDSSLLIDMVEFMTDSESDIDQFLTMEIKPYSFPIVRARVFRHSEKDVFCINMNHTPTDGAGLKKFVKVLASIYTDLFNNREIDMTAVINGDRSLRQITNYFTFLQKLRFVREGFRSPKKSLLWSFDWERTEEKQKYFSRMKINSRTFDRIKAYSKLNNATVNDIVLTAFIRSFATNNLKNSYASKPVIVPVDLRKYLKPESDVTICSLTGSIIINIGKFIGNNFGETLVMVKNEMEKKKAAHTEMYRLLQISVLSKFIPYMKLKEMLAKMKYSPIPLVTNVGIIDSVDICFGNIEVEDAFVTGAISLEDYFSMGFSTFQKNITFSVGYYGGEIQEDKVKNFLACLKAELENLQ